MIRHDDCSLDKTLLGVIAAVVENFDALVQGQGRNVSGLMHSIEGCPIALVVLHVSPVTPGRRDLLKGLSNLSGDNWVYFTMYHHSRIGLRLIKRGAVFNIQSPI